MENPVPDNGLSSLFTIYDTTTDNIPFKKGFNLKNIKGQRKLFAAPHFFAITIKTI